MSRPRSAFRVLAIGTLALWFASALQAEWIAPLPVSVPLDRLAQNLERLASAEPQNPTPLVNLARVYAMAFATGTASVTVVAEREPEGVLIGEGRRHLPFADLPSISRSTVAKDYLAAAIQAYERALALDPGNTVARLGYGWCLQSTGDTKRAVATYRQVIAEAWPRDSRSTSITSPPGAITAEAAGYLIALLDQERDAEEIRILRGYIAQLQKTRFISPIVVPLRERVAAHDLVNRSTRVRFDADGSGLDREWTWIAPDAGWLVYDPSYSGRITSALQLFGNVTFWMFWDNGYDALRALDDDANGSLTGGELKGLAIWQDQDGDGISDPGEVQPLAHWGIVSVSCAYEADDESDIYIASSPNGVTFTDGSTRPTYDVILESKR